MPQTARDFINLALKEAGILGIGQTANAEDINDCFTLLRRMLSQWQKRRWLVPMLYDLATTGNGLISNKIGPGQYWNAPRPDKIQSAYIIQLNTGTNPVSMSCKLVFSYEDYSLIAVKTLPSLPYLCFYDGAYPYGNIYFWPIPNSSYECHIIVKGSANWQQRIDTGVVIAAGAGMTDGVYLAVPLIGGAENQNSATLNITVVGGIATVVALNNPGQNYVINDRLGLDNSVIPDGLTSGFVYKVTNTTISLDSEFDMPEEYEEAIHYNLAIRMASMYKEAAMAETIALAKVSLNTIRAANTQVPTLGMPAGLGRGRAFNIYNADGY